MIQQKIQDSYVYSATATDQTVHTQQESYFEHLVASDLLSKDQVSIIQEDQQTSQHPIRWALIQSGFIDESTYLTWACALKHIDVVSLRDSDDITTIKKVNQSCDRSSRLALERNCFAVITSHLNKMTIAVPDPLDDTALQDITNVLKGFDITFVGCLERELRLLISDLSPIPEGSEGENNAAYITTSAANKNTPSLLENILEQAILKGASDIHFFPKNPSLSVKFRIDGELENVRMRHISEWPQLLSRLKVLAKMKIEEKSLPQFGRFSLFLQGRQVDFRASSHPTTDGESFVLRALDRMKSLRELDNLGFDQQEIDIIKQQISAPYGMIIMTGPTGSGKTTTLYSMLSYLKEHNKNIMTLEDPVEYVIPHIRQTQMNEDIDLTFAPGIRSVLRQDPDVILVGEIRDEETAQMALRAAMTGHLVLTTLHTNSSLSAPKRLLELGVPLDLLTGNINCILSQRLVKKPLTHSRGLQEKRQPVVEILPVSPALDRMFMKNEPYYDIVNYAKTEGFQTMSDKAQQKIKDGALLKEDVEKVLRLEPL